MEINLKKIMILVFFVVFIFGFGQWQNFRQSGFLRNTNLSSQVFSMHQSFQMSFLSTGNYSANVNVYSNSFRYQLGESWRFEGKVGLIMSPEQSGLKSFDISKIPYFWNGTLTYNSGNSILIRLSLGTTLNQGLYQRNFPSFGINYARGEN